MNNVIKGNLRSKTTWFGSALVVAGAILEAAPGFVEQYLPVLLAVVPPEYGKTLSVIGAAVVALRNVTSKPVAEKVAVQGNQANRQGGFARPLMLALLLAVAAPIAMLSGCASLGTSSASEKLIVQAATMKFIESSDDRAAKASRIVKAAAQARVWLDTDGVTIAELQTAMLDRIAAADLEPSDKLLASALVDVVLAELNVRIGEGVISPEKRATVNAVLGWVEQAASFYAG